MSTTAFDRLEWERKADEDYRDGLREERAAALARAASDLADIVEALQRGDDEAVPTAIRNPSDAKVAALVLAVRAAIANATEVQS